MAKRFGYLAGIALLCLLLGLLQRRYGAGSSPAAKWYSYQTFAFNTDCTIQLHAKDQTSAEEAAGKCIPLLAGATEVLNRFDPDSEVTRFNSLEAGAPFQCSDVLWRAFMAARDANALTEGAFDVTVGPLIDYWKRVANGEAPDETERLACLARTGMDKLAFDEVTCTVTKLADGVNVDFGGVAKGLVLDFVRERLQKCGIEHFILNFGGNIFVKRAEGEASGVAIRDPRNGETLCVAAQCNGRFVATSSNEYRALAPGKVSHIMDPRTGQPAAALYSVTAIAPEGAMSDVLSTAVFVGGIPLAEKVAASHPDVGFVILDGDGQMHCVGHIEVE